MDLLILLDKENVTRLDEKRVKYPLYEIEFDSGIIISPIVLSKKVWESKHKISPFYHNVIKERETVMTEQQRKDIIKYRL